MAGVYGKHMHRITGMVGIDEGQPEQLAGNNTLEKKLEFDPKMSHLSCKTLAHAISHFYHSIRLQPLFTQHSKKVPTLVQNLMNIAQRLIYST